MPPKLLVFAACEKVLVDQQNNASLIAVLQELTVQVPEPPPPPAPVPMVAIRWDAFSLWLKTADEDDSRNYGQRVALFDPSGNPTGIEGSAQIKFGDKLSLRNIATIFGFPIGATGRYVLKLWLSEGGQEQPEPIAEFPILLIRQSPKTEPPQPNGR